MMFGAGMLLDPSPCQQTPALSTIESDRPCESSRASIFSTQIDPKDTVEDLAERHTEKPTLYGS